MPTRKGNEARSPARRGADGLLLAALAAGAPVEQAAAQAGLSTRTAYRRLADPGFRSRLAAARDEVIVSALAALARATGQAVITLAELLESGDERVRLGAAKALLEQTLRLREAVLLEERLATLERRERKRGAR
jgi:hypothetical protein